MNEVSDFPLVVKGSSPVRGIPSLLVHSLYEGEDVLIVERTDKRYEVLAPWGDGRWVSYGSFAFMADARVIAERALRACVVEAVYTGLGECVTWPVARVRNDAIWQWDNIWSSHIYYREFDHD